MSNHNRSRLPFRRTNQPGSCEPCKYKPPTPSLWERVRTPVLAGILLALCTGAGAQAISTRDEAKANSSALKELKEKHTGLASEVHERLTRIEVQDREHFEKLLDKLDETRRELRAEIQNIK